MKKQPWQRELERKMREQTDRFVEYLGSGEFRNQMVSCGRELLNARLLCRWIRTGGLRAR